MSECPKCKKLVEALKRCDEQFKTGHMENVFVAVRALAEYASDTPVESVIMTGTNFTDFCGKCGTSWTLSLDIPFEHIPSKVGHWKLPCPICEKDTHTKSGGEE